MTTFENKTCMGCSAPYKGVPSTKQCCGAWHKACAKHADQKYNLMTDYAQNMNINDEARGVNKDARAPESPRNYAEEIARMRKMLVIRGENTNEFNLFAEQLLSELGVRNKIQMLYAENFIFAAWKYRRAAELERLALTKQNGPNEIKLDIDRIQNIKRQYRVRTLDSVDLSKEKIKQLIQYQFTLEKSMNKALRLLRAEQGLPVTKFDEPNDEE